MPVAYVEESWEASNFRLAILRHARMWHLCGYIGLPGGHEYWGRDYDDIPVPIHGGWTYTEEHLPGETADGRWYIGFDCAHSGDFVIGRRSLMGDDVYRSHSFVKAELLTALAEIPE